MKWKIILLIALAAFSSQVLANTDQDNKSIFDLMRFDPSLLATQNLSQADMNMPAEQFLRIQYNDFDIKALTIKLENALYSLHYYRQEPSGQMNAQLKNAIKAFQKDIQKPATGNLTVGELTDLIQRYEQAFPGGVHDGEIYPEKLKVDINDNMVIAKGTWLALNREHQYTSIETSEIRCNRRDDRCLEAMAMVVDGTTSKDPTAHDKLTVGSMIWNITSWDDSEIVATNTLNPCVSYSLFIEPKTKKVYLQYRYKDGQTCSHTEGEAPTINQLVDGPTFAKEYYHQKENRQERVYNSRYVARLKSL